MLISVVIPCYYSEKTIRKVVELVRTEHERAHSLLTEHRALLDQLAQVLYEKETITGEEFMRILHAAQKEEEHHA